MTRQSATHLTVRCPRCEIIIERVTVETMVYCLACRQWCREVEEQQRPALAPAPLRKPRRRFRCH